MSEFRRRLMIQGGGTGGKYIKFKDPVVEQICISKWSSDGIGLTPEDAAKVTDIGTTFRGNTEITSFDELDYFLKVKSLGQSAFAECHSLTSVDVSNITNMDSRVFSGCMSLDYVIGLDRIITMNTTVFYNALLTDMNICMPNLTGVLRWGVFSGTCIKQVSNLGNITSVGVGAGANNQGTFYNTKNLRKVVLPNSVVHIGTYCFNNSGLTEINLHSLQKIDNFAFSDCVNLNIEELLLPNITSVGDDAFRDVPIKKITNLGSITYAFKLNNKNVEYVRLPSTVTSAANFAFNQCSSLKTLIIDAVEPFPITEYFIDSSDPIKNGNGFVYVPDESVESYRNATNWSAFASQIKPISEFVEPNE